MNQRLNLSAGPHVRDRWTTPFIMMIVFIALVPTAAIGRIGRIGRGTRSFFAAFRPFHSIALDKNGKRI